MAAVAVIAPANVAANIADASDDTDPDMPRMTKSEGTDEEARKQETNDPTSSSEEDEDDIWLRQYLPQEYWKKQQAKANNHVNLENLENLEKTVKDFSFSGLKAGFLNKQTNSEETNATLKQQKAKSKDLTPTPAPEVPACGGDKKCDDDAKSAKNSHKKKIKRAKKSKKGTVGEM